MAQDVDSRGQHISQYHGSRFLVQLYYRIHQEALNAILLVHRPLRYARMGLVLGWAFGFDFASVKGLGTIFCHNLGIWVSGLG